MTTIKNSFKSEDSLDVPVHVSKQIDRAFFLTLFCSFLHAVNSITPMNISSANETSTCSLCMLGKIMSLVLCCGTTVKNMSVSFSKSLRSA